MNLILEPTKCKSLSICSGSSKEVIFKLSNMDIDSIVNSPEKFLGSKITFKGKPKEAFGFVKSGIIDCLENIDKTLISNDHKLEIYVKYLLPAVRFKLTVHEFSMSDLKKTGLKL